MAKTYTVLNDKAYKVLVTIDPEPTKPNQQIKISYTCQNVYQYDYEREVPSLTLAYRFDNGNWIAVSNGGTITTPNNSKELQIRLSYSLKIYVTTYSSYQNYEHFYDYATMIVNSKGNLQMVYENEYWTYVTRYESSEAVEYYNSGTWYSEPISLNNNPYISGSDTDLGEKSTAFNIEYSVNDTDPDDTITVKCYYDDALITMIENVVRDQKYRFMISNEMLAVSPINSTHTIKIEASDGKGQSTRTYTFIKNRNPEPYMDYIIKPVQTDDMATVIVVGQAAGAGQDFQVKVYVCNNAFDENPMWEDMSDQYYQGLSYSFLNTNKTADKWGISVRFVNSKYNENDQIDITGCGFWCNKMIVRS